MKKFLMAIIMLIPVVVVLALSATGSIIAAAKDVNATSIEVRNQDNQSITSNSTMSMDITDEYMVVYIDVLPTITYDDSITYEMSTDESYTGEVKVVRVGDSNQYRIIPVVSGPTRVIFRASNNREVYFSLNIYITSDEVSGLLIYDKEGGVVLSDMEEDMVTYELAAATTLYAMIYPTDAVSGNVSWSSSDTSVATITSNGTITPQKRGKAVITLTILQKSMEVVTIDFIVDTSEAVLKVTELYVTDIDIVDEDFIREYAVVDITNSEDLASLSIKATSGGYSVTLGGNTAIVKVYETAEGEFVFHDVPSTMYTDITSYALNCVYLAAGSEDLTGVEYSIVADNMGVAEIKSGALYPYVSGKITLVASYNDVIITKEIQIYENPTTFTMSLSKEDGELGIEMTRVWGFNWYTDSTYTTTTNTYQLTTDIAEGTVDLRWTSSNDEWATVDETGLITFYEAGAGQSITITASVYTNNYLTGVARSFTFNMTEELNSYNVGTYTTNDMDEKYENAAAVNATADKTSGNTIVLQGNVNYTELIQISASLYGNGFTIDVQYYEHIENVETNVIAVRASESVGIETDVLNIRNITVSGGADFESGADVKYGIRVYDSASIDCSIMYSVVRYIENGVLVYKISQNLHMEGNILGDCYFTGVSIFTEGVQGENTISFKDCIFKETNGPSIMSSSTNDLTDSDLLNINALPYIQFDGFIDIYNWKTVDELAMLANTLPGVYDVLEDFGISTDTISSALGTIFTSIFLAEDNVDTLYYYTDSNGDTEAYVSLGFLAFGCYLNNDPDHITINDEGLKLLSVSMPTTSGSTTEQGVLALALAVADSLVKDMVNENMTLYHPSLLLTYTIDPEDGPRNDPGDPVPQNTELYNKLNGTEVDTEEKEQVLTPEVV